MASLCSLLPFFLFSDDIGGFVIVLSQISFSRICRTTCSEIFRYLLYCSNIVSEMAKGHLYGK